jgi:hypothetical protein
MTRGAARVPGRRARAAVIMALAMDHAERLTRASHEVARLRAEIADDAKLRAWSLALKHWQSQRLARTHADLLASERYHDAARFFLEDLYGTKDFSARDAQLIRVIPALARTLPDTALETLADAVELDALSETLDDALARHLRSDASASIDEARYADAYREASMRAQREHQLELVLHIGASLDRLVKLPMLGTMLRAMTVPARLAGFGAMQEFLLAGFDAFKGIGGASEFLGLIDRRERTIMERLRAGVRTGWTLVPQS